MLFSIYNGFSEGEFNVLCPGARIFLNIMCSYTNCVYFILCRLNVVFADYILHRSLLLFWTRFTFNTQGRFPNRRRNNHIRHAYFIKVLYYYRLYISQSFKGRYIITYTVLQLYLFEANQINLLVFFY